MSELLFDDHSSTNKTLYADGIDRIGGDVRELTQHKAVIFCDIDGVLADCSHRLIYMQTKDYDKFYGANMADDEKSVTASMAIAEIMGLLTLYHIDNVKLVFLTGRPEKTRSLTYMWLHTMFPNLIKELSIKPTDIVCRRDGDHSPAPKCKLHLATNWAMEKTVDPRGNTVIASDIDRTCCDFYILDDDPEIVREFEENFGLQLNIKLEPQRIEGISCQGIVVGTNRFKSSEQNKSHAE